MSSSLSSTTAQTASAKIVGERTSLRPASLSSIVDAIPPQVRPGLLLLLQAHDYAIETSSSPWDFAVELSELRRMGISNADCRWLVCKKWVELARELPPRPEAPRRFQHDVGLSISSRSCLVLNELGERVARQLVRPRTATGLNSQNRPVAKIETAVILPQWDHERHELKVNGELVKQFKLPSPNQERILMALEEENWPARIDDPLPPSKKLDAKHRLHDTIKNLNRNQKSRLIRFMGDGTGQGIRWELFRESLVSEASDGNLVNRPK